MMQHADCPHDHQTLVVPSQSIDGCKHHPNLCLQATHPVNGWHLKYLVARILLVLCALVANFPSFHASLPLLFPVKDCYPIEFEFLAQALNLIIEEVEWPVATAVSVTANLQLLTPPITSYPSFPTCIYTSLLY